MKNILILTFLTFAFGNLQARQTTTSWTSGSTFRYKTGSYEKNQEQLLLDTSSKAVLRVKILEHDPLEFKQSKFQIGTALQMGAGGVNAVLGVAFTGRYVISDKIDSQAFFAISSFNGINETRSHLGASHDLFSYKRKQESLGTYFSVGNKRHDVTFIPGITKQKIFGVRGGGFYARLSDGYEKITPTAGVYVGLNMKKVINFAVAAQKATKIKDGRFFNESSFDILFSPASFTKELSPDDAPSNVIYSPVGYRFYWNFLPVYRPRSRSRFIFAIESYLYPYIHQSIGFVYHAGLNINLDKKFFKVKSIKFDDSELLNKDFYKNTELARADSVGQEIVGYESGINYDFRDMKSSKGFFILRKYDKALQGLRLEKVEESRLVRETTSGTKLGGLKTESNPMGRVDYKSSCLILK